jgi:hypothetical protein
VRIEALAGPDGLPEPDELTAIIAALEAAAGDLDAETPSRWRLAARDFDEVDFEFDRKRSRR